MLTNTPLSYGWIAIILHWLVAMIVLSLFGLGLYMVDLSYYDPWYQALPDWHRSLGIILCGLLLLRVCWRIVNPIPKPLESWNRFDKKVSGWVHNLLYLLLFSTILAGYLISTADGRAIDVFGWFQVPAIFPTVKGMEDIAGQLHEILAWVIFVTVGLHVLGALKHHFIDKDTALIRMLKPLTKKN